MTFLQSDFSSFNIVPISGEKGGDKMAGMWLKINVPSVFHITIDHGLWIIIVLCSVNLINVFVAIDVLQRTDNKWTTKILSRHNCATILLFLSR